MKKIILEIGAISGVVPEYLTFYFEPCAKDTILEGAELEIEIIPARGKCDLCGNEFELLTNGFVCPSCQGKLWELKR